MLKASDIPKNLLKSVEISATRPIAVEFDRARISVTLADGRVIANPVAWYPWLAAASPTQLANVRLYYYSIYWPDLDRSIVVEKMFHSLAS